MIKKIIKKIGKVNTVFVAYFILLVMVMFFVLQNEKISDFLLSLVD